ncbi:unnamed protein product, partial [Mesorhabditis belari]|uniref:receptor protein-tyrosine kinase n=1 Tax=Mesorhabditis belari TaxID=2138241 RepID=A0AAF3JAV1_9BILA
MHFILLLLTVLIVESREIFLSIDHPGETLHGKELNLAVETTIKINVTDGSKKKVAVRWSSPYGNDTGCRPFGSFDNNFEPPSGQSPNYAFGQCFMEGDSGMEIDLTKSHFADIPLFSFSATVFDYVKIIDSQADSDLIEFMTVPVEKLDADQYAKYVIGGSSDDSYAYFVTVAPPGETIFTKSLTNDRRTHINCVVDVFTGNIPAFGDNTNLLYCRTSNDTAPMDLNWRTRMVTYRFKNYECWAQIIHRAFMAAEDTPECNIAIPTTVPYITLLVNEDYPKSSKKTIAESRCFVYDASDQPRISVYLDKIVGGVLDITFTNSYFGYTKQKRIDSRDVDGSLAFCQIRATQISYTWIPSDDLNETSLILARIRANYDNQTISDCPFEPIDYAKDFRKPKISKLLWAAIIITGIIIVIILGILFYCLAFYRIVRWLRYLILRKKFAEDSVKHKRNQISVYKSETRASRNEPSSKDLWEMDITKLSIEKRLGRGAFSDVFFGKFSADLPCIKMFPALRSQFHQCNDAYEVAVKKPLGNTDDDKNSFLLEISMMKSVGYHRHLLSIVGCSTVPDSPMILTVFCEHGDLLTQVLKKNPHMKNTDLKNSPSALRSADFMSIAWQIADALMYLSSKNFVHRDVCASNVLLTRDKEAKLTDFGGNRINKETLIWARGGRLPVKWAAPEAIDLGVFTEKTDVWSFGVLLWEMYSLGESPFDHIQVREILSHLRQGLLLATPENCPDFVKNLMHSCWQLRPQERPSFTVLASLIETKLPSGQRMIQEIEFS